MTTFAGLVVRCGSALERLSHVRTPTSSRPSDAKRLTRVVQKSKSLPAEAITNGMMRLAPFSMILDTRGREQGQTLLLTRCSGHAGWHAPRRLREHVRHLQHEAGIGGDDCLGL